MEEFVERANIANFTARLKAETDPLKRALLLQLLVEEEAKLQVTLKTEK